MNIADVMDDLGTALEQIDGLRVFPYWADRVTPPAAVVAWPDPLTYDKTMARGADQQEFAIIVMVGKVNARATRDALAKYADGAGEHSIKRAIEAHQPTAYDSARVMRAEFGVVTVAGTELLAATFYIDLIGQGA